MVLKGTRTKIERVKEGAIEPEGAPHVPKLNDKDMEKTDEEVSDIESETEINEVTGFPVYKSKI